MPANRSRTLRWRSCLEDVRNRGGSIEIAVVRSSGGDDESRHLIWRVRVVSLTESEIVVEQPTSLGQLIPLESGVELAGIISVGQNRWMFHTTIVGLATIEMGPHRSVSALRLAMPRSVQRCQRRSHYRVQSATLNPPLVQLWPLLDPKSVVVAERANELRFLETQRAPAAGEGTGDVAMPEVGPRFTATLQNIGGGGLGLLVASEHSQVLSRHRLHWLSFELPPELDTPICATGKLVHTHMQANQSVYAGMAFDFSFNPTHRRFVVDQIRRYVLGQQRRQQDGAGAYRRTG